MIWENMHSGIIDAYILVCHCFLYERAPVFFHWQGVTMASDDDEARTEVVDEKPPVSKQAK